MYLPVSLAVLFTTPYWSIWWFLSLPPLYITYFSIQLVAVSLFLSWTLSVENSSVRMTQWIQTLQGKRTWNIIYAVEKAYTSVTEILPKLWHANQKQVHPAVQIPIAHAVRSKKE